MKALNIIFLVILCSTAYSQSSDCPNYDHHSIPKAEMIVEAILNQVGIKRSFPILECSDINNAVAVSIPTKLGMIKYIAYDYNFIKDIELETRTNWTVIFILAHEVGHHLHDHFGSNHKAELEADEFAGFILGRLGASLHNTLATIQEIGSHHSSDTHPAKDQRLDAIKKGWHSGSGKDLVSAPKSASKKRTTSRRPILISPTRNKPITVRTVR